MSLCLLPSGLFARGVGPFTLLFATLCSCGSEPADDAPTPDASIGDAVTADAEADAADVEAPDGSTSCAGAAGFECVDTCATDVSFAAECREGRWACPERYPLRFDECTNVCDPPPRMCCDAEGVELGLQDCVLGGLTCARGRADWCCDDDDEVCVQVCGDDWLQSKICVEGRLACPPGTTPEDEC